MISPTVIVIMIMGVSGSGKTTVGSALAHQLGWEFADSDDFHSPENIAKMHSGVPLTDEDREPWLRVLNARIRGWIDDHQPTVLACSALKRSYREALLAGVRTNAVGFVYLEVPVSELRNRMHEREGHYMPESLLGSQLATLEPPSSEEATTVDASGTVDQTVDAVKRALSFGN